MGKLTFVLASASSARRRLLETVGIKPIVLPSDFDESQVKLSDPAALVQTLALQKAVSVATSIMTDFTCDIPYFEEDYNLTESVILGCDSVLAFDGEIYGKPADTAEAIARWQKMRGQVGQLHTGHALIDLQQDKTVARRQVTEVYFAKVSDAEIEAYVATGEPLKCAGGFAIEGKGGLFVEKLQGCHSNVIGLSLPLLRKMLEQLGYSVVDFWRT